mgnify:CR=1 FL=1
MVKSLVIIGPGWPLRGGLAAFDHQLACTFKDKEVHSRIETFSLQYPSFLFPGTSQYTNEPAPKDVNIHEGINSINPFNWMKVGLQLKRERPDLIIVRYWIPFLAPCLGMICRIAKSNKHTKVIAIVDNMVPHEKRMGDKMLTRYFAKSVDGFVTMSNKVTNDVRYFSSKSIVFSPHPIFNHFGQAISKEVARDILNVGIDEKIILFFGYIRPYKGLDLLLNAMANNAINYADSVLTSGKASMITASDVFFGNNTVVRTQWPSGTKHYFSTASSSSETIWMLYRTAVTTLPLCLDNGYNQLKAGQYLPISNDYYTLLNKYPTDLRNNLIDKSYTTATGTILSSADAAYNAKSTNCNKYSFQGGINNLGSTIVLRATEMRLIQAEAYAKLGNTAKALENINYVRSRAGVPVFTITNWTTNSYNIKNLLDNNIIIGGGGHNMAAGFTLKKISTKRVCES